MPGLRYSAAEGGLISITFPDDEKDLDTYKPLPGEAMMKITREEYDRATGGDLFVNGADGLQALLCEKLGKEIPVPRHAVVDDKGDVLDVEHGWASLLPVRKDQAVRVPSKEAVPGDKYVDQRRTDEAIERIVARKAEDEAARLAEADLGG